MEPFAEYADLQDTDIFVNSEYNDWDATACALGDYNTFEENQVFLDHEGDDSYCDNVYEERDYDFE